VPSIGTSRIYSPQNLALSRANLSLHLCRHCHGAVWLYTRCRSGLLDRLVRCGDSCLFYDPYTVFSDLSSSGYEVCDGLSYTIRIIIGISICNPPSPLLVNPTPLTDPFPLTPVIFFFAILSLIGYRRRRAAQGNLVYLQQVPQGRGGVNGSPNGPNGGPPSVPPPYPAQTYSRFSLNTVVVQVRL